MERFISCLQIVSLICLTIVFTYRMVSIVEKYILRKPKEECRGMFIFIMIIIGVLYFVIQHYYKQIMLPFYEKMYNI